MILLKFVTNVFKMKHKKQNNKIILFKMTLRSFFIYAPLKREYCYTSVQFLQLYLYAEFIIFYTFSLWLQNNEPNIQQQTMRYYQGKS